MSIITKLRYSVGSQIILILVSGLFTTAMIYNMIPIPHDDFTAALIAIIFWSIVQSFVIVLLILFFFGRKPSRRNVE